MPNDLFAKKSLGQHWLKDEASLQAMCDAAELSSTDYVLEIGPGMGTLTKFLVEQAAHVKAIEFDPSLAVSLPGRIQSPKLEVITQDIMSFDFTSLPPSYKLVANIPYYLTSNLIRVISETTNPPAVAVLLVQKEVAERVAAKPGSLSILGVTAQYYWEVNLSNKVPAKLFTPPPRVDSRILVMRYRAAPLFNDVKAKDFFRVVKAGFAQKRKTLLNSLSSGLHLDKDTVISVCASVDIDPKRRAQTLSINEWHNLYISLNT